LSCKSFVIAAYLFLNVARLFAEPGIVVESVPDQGALQQAGLQAGDILLSWYSTSAHGSFQSPFDLTIMVRENAAFGPITLDVRRNGQPLAITINSEEWQMRLKPDVPLPEKDFEKAAADQSLAWQTRTWLYAHAADTYSDAQDFSAARAALIKAMQIAQSKSLIYMAILDEHMGELLVNSDQAGEAKQYLQESLALYTKLSPNSFFVPLIYSKIGTTEMALGNLSAAEQFCTKA